MYYVNFFKFTYIYIYIYIYIHEFKEKYKKILIIYESILTNHGCDQDRQNRQVTIVSKDKKLLTALHNSL